MLRRGSLLFVLVAALAAGCSIDRVEWESAGFPVEEVTHALEEEHHVEHPAVECIQREAAGSLWECRAHAGTAEFECEIHVGMREAIRKLHCEQEHEAEAPTERGRSAPRALRAARLAELGPRRCMVIPMTGHDDDADRHPAPDQMLGQTPDAEAVGRGPAGAKKPARRDYHHPAAAWGAARSVARVLWRSREPVHGPRAVLRMNHEDKGFDCPGCAWPDDPKGLHLDICENGIKHVTWEMTRKKVGGRVLRRPHRHGALRLERLRARGSGAADRAARLRRGERHLRPDLLAGCVRARRLGAAASG